MSRWLVIAAYQCRINGVATGSVDFRVRYFNLPGSSDVRATLEGEPPDQYQNDQGEAVSWPLVRIFDIQPLPSARSGNELIGFIVRSGELAGLGGMDLA